MTHFDGMWRTGTLNKFSLQTSIYTVQTSSALLKLSIISKHLMTGLEGISMFPRGAAEENIEFRGKQN